MLPFDNLSGDPEQEYFADGIAEDLITRLSAWRDFPVIARNSSFTYKGKPVDVKQVSRELGVRYVVEGSVRKAGDRVRITAQLIDATTGGHVWAERYDRELEDIFAIQDEITTAIAGAMGAKLAVTEEERAAQQQPQNLTAYDLLMRGRYCHAQGWLEGNFDEMQAEARSCFERAIEIRSQICRCVRLARVDSLGGLVQSELTLLPNRRTKWSGQREGACRSTRSCQSLTSPWALPISSGASTTTRSQLLATRSSWTRASLAHTGILGSFLADAGEPDEAIAVIEKGMRLSPRDPWLFRFLAAKG